MTAAARLPRTEEGDSNAFQGDVHDVLEDIIYRKSFGRGAVKLSSGRESNFYFDMKPSMLDPEGAFLIADRILREVTAVDARYVGGLEMGAVPITGAVCERSHGSSHPVFGFFVRKKPKEHGAKKVIEGLPKGENLSGQRVVIVDDVTTSGMSALVAVEACKKDGANIAMVVSIVDREEGAADEFKRRGIPFKSLFTASAFLRRDD